MLTTLIPVFNTTFSTQKSYYDGCGSMIFLDQNLLRRYPHSVILTRPVGNVDKRKSWLYNNQGSSWLTYDVRICIYKVTPNSNFRDIIKEYTGKEYFFPSETELLHFLMCWAEEKLVISYE